MFRNPNPPRLTGAAQVTINGHMGELLQGRMGENGPVALVTLPMPKPVVRVSRVCRGAFGAHYVGGSRTVSRHQIAQLVGLLTGAAPRGRWVVEGLMPPGSGGGTSTATLLGIARVLGFGSACPAKLAETLVAIEGASDPLMFAAPDRILWASRLGIGLQNLPGLPRIHVVAGLEGAATRTDPEDQRFSGISDLVEPWAAACGAGNRAEIGRLATISACRNIALRGGAPLEPLMDIAQKHGAIGVAVAHTGSARSLLFTPGSGDPNGAATDMRLSGMTGLRRFATGADQGSIGGRNSKASAASTPITRDLGMPLTETNLSTR